MDIQRLQHHSIIRVVRLIHQLFNYYKGLWLRGFGAAKAS
jgi:hypothetical protein